MADMFAFVDNSDTVLLDLNTSDAPALSPGWHLHRGLDIGAAQIERVYLSQPPYDGSTLATSRRPIVTMKVPLFIWPQDGTTVTDYGTLVSEKLKALMELMYAQLDADTNILKYVPDGWVVDGLGAYYFNTYRSTMPSLMRGMDIPSPFLIGHTGVPIIFEIDREPDIKYSANSTYADATIGGFVF